MGKIIESIIDLVLPSSPRRIGPPNPRPKPLSRHDTPLCPRNPFLGPPNMRPTPKPRPK